MSTKSEQLRELARQIHAAEAANPGVEQLQFEAAERLREFADRLDAVSVSDAMVECASDAYATLSLDGVDMTAMRHALESILPIADEKDAELPKGKLWWPEFHVSHRKDDYVVIWTSPFGHVREICTFGKNEKDEAYFIANACEDYKKRRSIARVNGDPK